MIPVRRSAGQSIKTPPPLPFPKFPNFRNIPKLFHNATTANPQNAMRNASQWLGDGLEEAFEWLGLLVDVGVPTFGAVGRDDDGDGDDGEVVALKTWGVLGVVC